MFIFGASRCKGCQKHVPCFADSCPHCGELAPTSRCGFGRFGWVVILTALAVGSLCAWRIRLAAKAPKPSASLVRPTPKARTGEARITGLPGTGGAGSTLCANEDHGRAPRKPDFCNYPSNLFDAFAGPA